MPILKSRFSPLRSLEHPAARESRLPQAQQARHLIPILQSSELLFLAGDLFGPQFAQIYPVTLGLVWVSSGTATTTGS
jgi:hypothetical protein